MGYTKFNNQLDPRKAIKFSDVISNKNASVHRDLYEDALAEMQQELSYSSSDYTFSEIVGSYFDTPSRVIVTDKKFPFKRRVIDLTPYWKTYQFKKDAADLKIDEFSILTSEIIYKDYVNGTAIIRSKYTGVKTVIDLAAIPEGMKLADEFSREQTFGYKLENHMSN